MIGYNFILFFSEQFYNFFIFDKLLIVDGFDYNIRSAAPKTKCNYNIRIFFVINMIQVLTAYLEITDAKISFVVVSKYSLWSI